MRWTLWAAMLGLGACAASQNEAPDVAATAAAVTPAVVSITTGSPEARTLYDEALAAQDNFRIVDAITGFEGALTEDPEFAMAKARLGALTPGNDGVLWLRQAAEDAKVQALPEAEQTQIGAFLAFAEGDQARGNAIMQRVAELAPGEWRAHLQIGTAAFFDEDFDQARTSLEKAVALNPDAGPAWNMLGYTRSELGNTDDAVAAFEHYATLAPGEANPHDSIGEILMRAGRYAEAETAFTKAAEIDESFFVGWSGVAQTRFLRGDWAGGNAALAKARAAATRETDRIAIRTTGAWAKLAQGDPAGAHQQMAMAADEAKAAELYPQYAFNAITLGNMRAVKGDWTGALAAYTSAMERVDKTGIEGGTAVNVRASAALGKAYAHAGAGNTKKATAALPDVDALLERQPAFEPLVLMARGAILRASGDPAAAVDVLSECGGLQYRCLHDLAAAQDAAGDKAAAQATRAAILKLNARAPDYLVVWKAAGGAATP